MNINRREFIGTTGATGLGLLSGCRAAGKSVRRPNVVFVFADQWRASATGYAGDPNVKTPHLDLLAQESVNFRNAVSCCPVCSPARASMITGQYPLTHGIFLNDAALQHSAPSIADCFNEAGYQTGYIGKWHLDGHGRKEYIPPERRQGFRFWQAYDCSHDYNDSPYYDNNDPEIKKWEGYDAFDQTRHAIRFIEENRSRPFMLFLSWGPPHDPYLTAPEKFRKLYDPDKLRLPPNVPQDEQDFFPYSRWHERYELKPADRSRHLLAGYYAHCTALDECVGTLQTAIRQAGLEKNTIFVFTSDHGDMLGSQGLWLKQWPYDESARVPFLLKYPVLSDGRSVNVPLNTPDIMPTLCGLCDIPVPPGVQGQSYAPLLDGGEERDEAALIANYHPFGWWAAVRGGREWRGVRTARHTYVRTLEGPWLLFDNETDPYQMTNLVNQPEHSALQTRLEQKLQEKLRETGDRFEKGMEYVRRWNIKVNQEGTIPITYDE
jgi:arylsulfatase A-like enzyme